MPRSEMDYTPSPAGFWKRYVAYFIDIVLLYIVVEILSTLYFSFQAYSQAGLLKDLAAESALAGMGLPGSENQRSGIAGQRRDLQRESDEGSRR